MRRLILALLLVAPPVFAQTPTPTSELILLAQQYNMAFNPREAAGPTPTATPTAGPSPTATPTAGPSGVTFTEAACASLPGDWVNVSTDVGGGGGWVESVGSDCEGVAAADFERVAMIQGPTESDDLFCSMRVTQTSGNRTKNGCIFRAQVTGDSPDEVLTGNHYEVTFDNDNNKPRFEEHTVNGGNSHFYVDDISGLNCTTCDSWIDVGDNDYIGMTLRGTTFGTTEAEDIRVSWWDWGSTLIGAGEGGGDVDLGDTSTWGTATCVCTAADLNTLTGGGQEGENMTALNNQGWCGPESYAHTAVTANEPNMTTFECGDE